MELEGFCYCERIRFRIELKSDTEVVPLYCHCESCRRAHAAPLYQIVYIPPDCFVVTEGQDLLSSFLKNVRCERFFCTNCGSRIYNQLHGFVEGSKTNGKLGIFPALLNEDIQHKLPKLFQPNVHLYSNEAVIDMETLNDNIRRHTD
ncbi:hypothetical protein SARC_07983 [Sphaeroforma arctica JP610]|uniref:CENP-V/GFA domain-containing protein n=1 Tax=Sphaeroforma arctica JP610 TaxID=667725 RepID=A0A0L0FS63_9EUKA|nr:hypothetical protein SARC_07983 [Sphaeroforma arctica JP610]KNC79632.1 hypothetical protein SARC_07983 [Sphaeroforma arctica JP610]|eukprot:XP_014153534.1 hypothetical protein SARC_07983 [Sphaeroforma arctica JP610]